MKLKTVVAALTAVCAAEVIAGGILTLRYMAEGAYKAINILRPTVIFGERNRGNVYNLLRQISSGKFLMVGKGENKKSMAYVGNIVAFIKCAIFVVGLQNILLKKDNMKM